MFVPFRRATLLIPSGPEADPERKHLFILLTDPVDGGDGSKPVLLVSISSVPSRRPFDSTCRLFPGDHPFIVRDSYVAYARARIECADRLLRGVHKGVFEARDAMETDIFARVCHGLLESPQTPREILEFYNSVNS